MKLNFPEYSFQIKTEKNKNYIFDGIRKKYVVLTPEEWVRQHLIHYLKDQGYPTALMSVEKQVGRSKKRYDLVVMDRTGSPLVIAECKAPSVSLGKQITEQISSYLMLLPAPYIMLTNGYHHHFFERTETDLIKAREIPPFTTLSQ